MKKTAPKKMRSWKYEIFILIEFLLLLWICWQVAESPVVSMIAVLAFYMIFGVILRLKFQKEHRRGIRLYRKGEYEAALEAFDRSEIFFETHPWIDRFRFLLMLDPANCSYREMALLNCAACYGHLGRGEEAMACYQKIEEDKTNQKQNGR